MSGLYTPLRIAEQLKANIPDKYLQKDADGSGLDALLRPLMGQRDVKPLNLDDLLSWTVGSSFYKRSYSGAYSFLNDHMLIAGEKYKESGWTYKKTRRYFRDVIAFSTVFYCWEQYKQAYRFDADFIDELMRTNSVEMPVSVLKRLPFRCFYLDLEEVGRFEPVIGIFAYMGFDKRTNLPNLGVFPVKRPRKEEENIPVESSFAAGEDMMKWNMLFTNEQGESCIRFTNDKELLNTLPDQKDVEVFDIFLFVLQAMLYLSSNRPDMMKSPKQKRVNVGKGTKREGTEAELTLMDVGVRYGSAIRKMKKKAEAKGEKTAYKENGTKRKPITSHVRAAHWHCYWVGKGRTKRIVKWIPPTFVSGTGKEMPVTIHKVE